MIKSVIEYVVKSLVDKPDQVVISETKQDNKRVIGIKVAEDDLGRVIGKDGQTIRVLRSLAMVINTADELVAVDIIK